MARYSYNSPEEIEKIGKITFDHSSLYLKPDPSRISINDAISIRPLNIAELQQFTGKAVPTVCKDAVAKAFQYEGVRYRRGGTSTRGMDCSGLVYTCYSAFGIALPRSSFDMSKSVYDVPNNDARKGDLIFFKTNGRKSINHVGLVIEANGNEIKFIHASIKNGVIVSSTKEPYYSRTFAKVGRVPA